MPRNSFARRSIASIVAFAMLVDGAFATWSVVAVDTRSREVCVASATCLANFNLKRNAAVVVPGLGGAMAQSLVDTSGQNRVRIHDGILAGEPTAAILAGVLAQDSIPQQRQYGIVTMDDDPVTFTGTFAGLARAGVAGQVGTLKYAIQGNVLTGAEVISAAETAFRNTEGDITARVMAAMEAAAALGGDGRCSCAPSQPTSCGVPPDDFDYPAYTGFITLARFEDSLGTCGTNAGCANGSYTMDINVISDPTGPDPVVEMRSRYETWRFGQRFGMHPSLTTLTPTIDSLVADGRSAVFVQGIPRNIDGDRLSPQVLWDVQLVQVSPGAPVAIAGPSGSHGPNRAGFVMTATGTPGVGVWEVTAGFPSNRLRLFPDLELRVDPVTPLHVGRDEVDADKPGRIPFHFNLEAADAGRPYLLMASASGTSPGTPFGNVVLPLNYDPLLRMTYRAAGRGRLFGMRGTLDAEGRAYAELRVTPGMLTRWAGRRIDWAAVVFGDSDEVTNVVGFDVR